MTINNNNIQEKEVAFDRGLQGLRKVTLTPGEKGAVFKTLLKYAETHEPVAESSWAAFVRFMKGVVAVRNK